MKVNLTSSVVGVAMKSINDNAQVFFCSLRPEDAVLKGQVERAANIEG
jgi:hypothetical protein